MKHVARATLGALMALASCVGEGSDSVTREEVREAAQRQCVEKPAQGTSYIDAADAWASQWPEEVRRFARGKCLLSLLEHDPDPRHKRTRREIAADDKACKAFQRISGYTDDEITDAEANRVFDASLGTSTAVYNAIATIYEGVHDGPERKVARGVTAMKRACNKV